MASDIIIPEKNFRYLLEVLDDLELNPTEGRTKQQDCGALRSLWAAANEGTDYTLPPDELQDWCEEGLWRAVNRGIRHAAGVFADAAKYCGGE